MVSTPGYDFSQAAPQPGNIDTNITDAYQVNHKCPGDEHISDSGREEPQKGWPMKFRFALEQFDDDDHDGCPNTTS